MASHPKVPEPRLVDDLPDVPLFLDVVWPALRFLLLQPPTRRLECARGQIPGVVWIDLVMP